MNPGFSCPAGWARGQPSPSPCAPSVGESLGLNVGERENACLPHGDSQATGLACVLSHSPSPGTQGCSMLRCP